jgi:predicted small integral membrane protein
MQMLEWMAWTQPWRSSSAASRLMLVGMTVWEVVWPTVERKGFLPMTTTRGDRLFIGLLGAPSSISAGSASPNGRSGGPLAIAAVWFAVVPSTLSRDEQMAEMQFFIDAASQAIAGHGPRSTSSRRRSPRTSTRRK